MTDSVKVRKIIAINTLRIYTYLLDFSTQIIKIIRLITYIVQSIVGFCLVIIKYINSINS